MPCLQGHRVTELAAVSRCRPSRQGLSVRGRTGHPRVGEAALADQVPMPRCFPKIRHSADRCRQSVALAVQVSMLHRGSSTRPSDESGTARAQQIGALYASHLATATVVAVARHPELFRLGAHYVCGAPEPGREQVHVMSSASQLVAPTLRNMRPPFTVPSGQYQGEGDMQGRMTK